MNPVATLELDPEAVAARVAEVMDVELSKASPVKSAHAIGFRVLIIKIRQLGSNYKL